MRPCIYHINEILIKLFHLCQFESHFQQKTLHVSAVLDLFKHIVSEKYILQYASK